MHPWFLGALAGVLQCECIVHNGRTCTREHL